MKLPLNVYKFSESKASAVNLINVSDAVMGKLGCGVLSEIWAAQIAFACMPQEGFEEYRYFKKCLDVNALSRELPRKDCFSGGWYSVLEVLYACDKQPPGVLGSGEVIAAHRITELWGGE